MSDIGADHKLVTHITSIACESGKQQEALSLMKERARFMKKQPGFVSIDLYRSIDGRRIINVVQWRGDEPLKSAHKSPEFRKGWDKLAETAHDIEPTLYEAALTLA